MLGVRQFISSFIDFFMLRRKLSYKSKHNRLIKKNKTFGASLLAQVEETNYKSASLKYLTLNTVNLTVNPDKTDGTNDF